MGDVVPDGEAADAGRTLGMLAQLFPGLCTLELGRGNGGMARVRLRVSHGSHCR